ncbi:ATP-binding protein, partial [Actinophytocola sp.]|uniref:ATP-binding protein n=1 Tax=Actinophytocola sp. TaxID=1872138 RepID=UPI0039C86125
MHTELRTDGAHHCRLTIADTGPGIDHADLPHVFDRFYRAPAARAMPGSGLGLAVVAQTAVQHGGTITATACSSADAGGLFFLAVTSSSVVVITAPSPPGLRPARQAGNTERSTVPCWPRWGAESRSRMCRPGRHWLRQPGQPGGGSGRAAADRRGQRAERHLGRRLRLEPGRRPPARCPLGERVARTGR